MTGLRPRFATLPPLAGVVLLSAATSAAGVVGGAPTPRATYPFFVEVGSGCGGALVAPDRVLTAAHCLEVVGERRVVRVGPGRVQRAVRRLAIHPVAVVARRRAQREFPPQPPDLMLLELASPVTGVAPVALASAADAATTPGAELVTMGVGASRKDGTGRGPFRSGVVAVQDAKRRCADQLPTARERAWSLCTRDPRVDRPAAGAPPFVSACFGDSGGPLVQVRDGVPRLVGVVSWGPSCGTQRDPEVYADVTRAAAFAGSARPVWAPLAAGAPTLVGTPRVGGLLACRVRWVQAPTRVTVTFAVDGRVRQSDGRRTYRVRAEDRGHPVVCDAAGATAGGPGGTPLSAPRVVG